MGRKTHTKHGTETDNNRFEGIKITNAQQDSTDVSEVLLEMRGRAT